ncbi:MULTISPECIES: DUF4231 domain-containing protein [unclassified Bradyrhizobium]|uniref:DUF4231 domain-containing protein n=1 Tax=unclassified Bradyrhizobium TaxID=2631580 RepID=UPI002915D4CE|nr:MULTISPECIES: DUF4231 domain-containing protein [unclassified Bradyrhizobium]
MPWWNQSRPDEEPNSGYGRLEQQIAWYDRKSRSAQRYFKWGKYLVIVASAAIPIAALTDHKILTAALGGFVAICEAVQHVNQWQHNWITYRSTCEALRHEKYTFIESADPYSNFAQEEARKLLVERVESLISTEHSKWIAGQERAADTLNKAEPRPSRSTN